MRKANVLVVLAVLLLTSGCGLVPSRPDVAGWLDTARQGLEDSSSEVATVGEVLQLEQQSKLVGEYGVTAVTTAEESLGKAETSLLSQQPPAPARGRFDKVSSALGDASDLVTRARIALVDNDHARYTDLVQQLRAMAKRLDRLRNGL